MQYKLKISEAEFQVTREGEFEYVAFKHNEAYERIPEEEAARFEEIEEGGDF